MRQWIEHWVSIGCPGNKRRREVSTRAIETAPTFMALSCRVEEPSTAHYSPKSFDLLAKLHVVYTDFISCNDATCSEKL